MDFAHSDTARELQERTRNFMQRHVLPVNNDYLGIAESGRYPLALVDDLKAKAKAEGLWNLFLPGLRPSEPGTRLRNKPRTASSFAPDFSSAWKSQACAAASNSMPMTLPTLAAISRRRRAPCAAIETWSSWLADVGMESTLAG